METLETLIEKHPNLTAGEILALKEKETNVEIDNNPEIEELKKIFIIGKYFEFTTNEKQNYILVTSTNNYGIYCTIIHSCRDFIGTETERFFTYKNLLDTQYITWKEIDSVICRNKLIEMQSFYLKLIGFSKKTSNFKRLPIIKSLPWFMSENISLLASSIKSEYEKYCDEQNKLHQQTHQNNLKNISVGDLFYFNHKIIKVTSFINEKITFNSLIFYNTSIRFYENDFIGMYDFIDYIPQSFNENINFDELINEFKNLLF